MVLMQMTSSSGRVVLAILLSKNTAVIVRMEAILSGTYLKTVSPNVTIKHIEYHQNNVFQIDTTSRICGIVDIRKVVRENIVCRNFVQ